LNVRGYPDKIRGLKEQMCSISLDFDYEMKSNDDPISLEDRSYELPT